MVQAHLRQQITSITRKQIVPKECCKSMRPVRHGINAVRLQAVVSSVESLQSRCIHTQFHWSSGPPVCFPSWGTRVQSPGGYLCETGILLLALSCYIGDPNVIDHCGLISGGVRPEPSLGHRADNVIIPLDLTQLFCPCFMLAAGSPSGFTTNIVGCWGGVLWRACNLTTFTPCLTVMYFFIAIRIRLKSMGGDSCTVQCLFLWLYFPNPST